MKATIKQLLVKLFPGWATQFFSARARAYSQSLAARWGCIHLNEKIIQQFGNKVRHGPFAGIVLSPETQREHLAPFLLGTYEIELHATWDLIFRMKFAQILDVGAKFGFYAVGLAQHYPSVPVVAFDTDPWARQATKEMCSANQVAIQVRGFCDPAWLCTHLQKNAFVLSDCEGYEATLFGSAEIPNLASATMLIEMHEQFSPGVTQLIRNKYSETHDISTITARSDGFELPSELAAFTEAERKMATSEYRTTQQSWLFCRPRR